MSREVELKKQTNLAGCSLATGPSAPTNLLRLTPDGASDATGAPVSASSSSSPQNRNLTRAPSLATAAQYPANRPLRCPGFHRARIAARPSLSQSRGCLFFNLDTNKSVCAHKGGTHFRFVEGEETGSDPPGLKFGEGVFGDDIFVSATGCFSVGSDAPNWSALCDVSVSYLFYFRSDDDEDTFLGCRQELI